MNVGPEPPPPVDGMLTSVAWELADGTVAYALEGAIFVTGAAVQWLRDGLGLDRRRGRDRAAGGVGARHRRRRRRAGVHRPRAARTGIRTPAARSSASLRGTTRAHLARAVVEAMAYQTRDVVEAMAGAAGCDDHRAAGRRRRLGDGPAAAAPGRPARRHGQPAPHARRRRPSARPTWPGWPRACGAGSTRWPRSGSSTPRSSPIPTAAPPTPPTSSGSGRSSGPRRGRARSGDAELVAFGIGERHPRGTGPAGRRGGTSHPAR